MSAKFMSIHGLRFDNLRNDLYGGLTAAVVALPLAMAFGVASGAGPMAGLYGAIFIGLFASIFGGTPSQISGPTGPMTVVMTGIIITYTTQFPETGLALAFTVVIMGGAFQILFGLFRLGQFIRLVPHPVISGFMSGIGVIIILLQIPPLLGHPSLGAPLQAVQKLPELVSDINFHALALGALVLIIIYAFPPKLNRIIPAPLFVLVAGTLFMVFFYPEGIISILGDIPQGFPSLRLPVISLAMLPDMIKSALILALLGSIDSLLTSLVADSVTRTHHDSNRELIGQGIGNMAAGMFGGLPGAGATMRTVVNVRAGGRTPISGIIHALTLLAIVIGAGTMAELIPHVVLAGILIKVGTDIIDWDYIKRTFTAPRIGVILMFVVMFITVFVDLITAVAVGMIVSSLILVQRMAGLQMKTIRVITDIDEESPLCEEAMAIIKASVGRILVYHLSGPLSFGAAKDMAKRLALIDGYEVLLLDFSDVSAIDSTTGFAIEEMIRSAHASNRQVYLSGVGPSVKEILSSLGVFELIGEGHDFKRRLHALQKAAESIGISV